MSKFATITRGDRKGEVGEVVEHHRSRRAVTIKLSDGQTLDISSDWVIISDYDRRLPQRSRLFG